MSLLRMLLIAGFVVGCQADPLEIQGDQDSSLSSINVASPTRYESKFDSVSIKIDCYDCTGYQSGDYMVNTSVDLQKKPFIELTETLKQYKFTEGTKVFVDLSYHLGDEDILVTCESGLLCKDYTHLLAKDPNTGSFAIKVRLIDLKGNPPPQTTPNEEGNLDIEPIVDNGETPEGFAAGEALYKETCSVCHGAEGGIVATKTAAEILAAKTLDKHTDVTEYATVDEALAAEIKAYLESVQLAL